MEASLAVESAAVAAGAGLAEGKSSLKFGEASVAVAAAEAGASVGCGLAGFGGRGSGGCDGLEGDTGGRGGFAGVADGGCGNLSDIWVNGRLTWTSPPSSLSLADIGLLLREAGHRQRGWRIDLREIDI